MTLLPKQGNLGNIGRPPHLNRIDQVFPEHPSPPISHHLSGQDNEKSAEEIQCLLVIALHDSDGANGVGVATALGDPAIGDDRDDDMLLYVEGARVEAEAPPPEQSVLLVRESGGHELPEGEHGNLHEDGGDGEWLSSVDEEGVEEYEECAGGDAQHPCTECHHRETRIVRLRDHQRHLLHGASLCLIAIGIGHH